MCGDVNSSLPYRNYDGGVVKISRRSSKLYDIADFKFVQRGLFGERALCIVACQKIEEVFHARPCGSAVIYAYVIPAESGRKVHIFAPAYMHCEAKLVQSPPIFSKL